MKQRRALVIDDEPDITTYLGSVLTDNGWAVSTANDGETGLALARKETPDAILLDIMMPQRGGLSCLVAIRKDPAIQGIPVVIVSGIQEQLTSDFHHFLDRARHYHPDAYLDKPVDIAKLIETLDRLTTSGESRREG